jgi:hypothetical protein
MRQKTSTKLNDVILSVMYQVKDKYRNDSRYKVIMTGLKSASRALTEITLKEIEDFSIDNE